MVQEISGGWPVVVVGHYIDGVGRARTGRVTLSANQQMADPFGRISAAGLYQDWVDPQTGEVAIPVLTGSPGGDVLTFDVAEYLDGATPVWWDSVAVAPGVGADLTDAVLVADSAILTSAAAAFDSNLIGTYLGSPWLTPLTQVESVQSAHSLTMTLPAPITASDVNVQLDAIFDLSSLSIPPG